MIINNNFNNHKILIINKKYPMIINLIKNQVS